MLCLWSMGRVARGCWAGREGGVQPQDGGTQQTNTRGKFSIYTAFIVSHKSSISKNSNLLPCNSLKLSDDPLAKEESVQDWHPEEEPQVAAHAADEAGQLADQVLLSAVTSYCAKVSTFTGVPPSLLQQVLVDQLDCINPVLAPALPILIGWNSSNMSWHSNVLLLLLLG